MHYNSPRLYYELYYKLSTISTNIGKNHCYIDICKYSKYKYEEVVERFYYTYINYEKYPKMELEYCWLHFRDSLYKGKNIYVGGDWKCFLHQLGELIEEKKDTKLYMILSQGWVYEGFIKEILNVLGETDGLLEDFYIVSPQFDWMIAYCDDGESAALYRT